MAILILVSVHCHTCAKSATPAAGGFSPGLLSPAIAQVETATSVTVVKIKIFILALRSQNHTKRTQCGAERRKINS